MNKVAWAVWGIGAGLFLCAIVLLVRAIATGALSRQYGKFLLIFLVCTAAALATTLVTEFSKLHLVWILPVTFFVSLIIAYRRRTPAAGDASEGDESTATMNINGTYKVNIEQTVRKLGESEDATIERLLRCVGMNAADIPKDHRKEVKIQKLIGQYRQDELATTMRLEIDTRRASIRSTDGDADYRIKRRTSSGDGKVSLVLEVPDEDEDMRWNITVCGDRFLVFSGEEEDEMSGFVWERV